VIFRPEIAKLIRQGRKSQLRTPLRTGTFNVPRCRYTAGRAYSVQPGCRDAICQITVTDVRQEQLGKITLPDVKREGFVTTAEFIEHWCEVHGYYRPEQEVWVVAFRLGDATDTPRLLAARPGPPDGDYTSNVSRAMRDEPEAVSEWVQEQFSAGAADRDEVRRRAGDAETPLFERLRRIEERALAGDERAQRDLFVINQRIQKSEGRKVA
jgi:hypothetical protein